MPEDKDPSLDYIASEVRKYHEAFRQEFEALNSSDVHAIKEKVKEKFAASLLSFVDTIIDLSTEAEADGVRLSAAKFGLNFVLGDVVEKPEDDPLAKLINGLIKKEQKSSEKARKEAGQLEQMLEEGDTYE
jgi:hypothetical protein